MRRVAAIIIAAMARDVFISYSQPDKATADEVCRLLEVEGISCWIAPRNVPPGSTWASAIVEAIESSKVFLLLSSHHSNQSRQMSRELQLADQQRLPVIPVRLSDVDFRGDYSYFLSSTQWLDLFPGSIAEHRTDLLSGVRRALAAKDPEPTPPVATAPTARVRGECDHGLLRSQPGAHRRNRDSSFWDCVRHWPCWSSLPSSSSVNTQNRPMVNS